MARYNVLSWNTHFQGPVVQSIISLTSSLTVVAKVFSNTLIFFLRNVSSFCKATQMFSAKNVSVLAIFQDRNFNITLAYTFVKF